MTVLGALARSGQPEERAVQATPWGDWGDSGPSWSGVNVTNESSLQLLTVYGCNRFICEGISTLPVDAFRSGPSGPQEVPLPGWLDQPTPDLNRIAWLTQLLTSLLLAGNAYCFKDYGPRGLRYLFPVDPSKVQVRREAGRKVFSIEGKDYTSAEIHHIPGVMFPGADVGLSPVEAARQSVGLGMSAQEFGARFFGQGAVMSGVIEVPGEMPPDKTREMARAWKRHHSGKSKSHLPGVLQGGATWKQTQVTNEQAQFLATRKFTASEIAGQMFLIDPPELGLPVEGSSQTYTNIEQRNIRKVQVTFLPWMVRLETAFDALLPERRYVKLNASALLRGDTKTRYEAYAIGVRNRFVTPNEARDFEDWLPLDGGDEFPEVPAPRRAND